MSFVRFVVGVAFALLFATMPALAVDKGVPRATAPADEYFGPLKMSVLGVRNALAAVTARQDAGIATTDDATLRNLALVERSMREWALRYPRDWWLPRMYARLQRIYARTPGQDQLAESIAARLIIDYPDSSEARALVARISRRVALGPEPLP